MDEITLLELCRRHDAVITRIGQLNGNLPWDAGDRAAKRNLRICRKMFKSACVRWRHGEADARAAVKLLT
jgi:hypothetical protein